MKVVFKSIFFLLVRITRFELDFYSLQDGIIKHECLFMNAQGGIYGKDHC